jgi:hypothetical protein
MIRVKEYGDIELPMVYVEKCQINPAARNPLSA